MLTVFSQRRGRTIGQEGINWVIWCYKLMLYIYIFFQNRSKTHNSIFFCIHHIHDEHASFDYLSESFGCISMSANLNTSLDRRVGAMIFLIKMRHLCGKFLTSLFVLFLYRMLLRLHIKKRLIDPKISAKWHIKSKWIKVLYKIFKLWIMTF